MKRTVLSPSLIKKLQRIKRRDVRLSQKIQKRLKQFQADPHHPGLRIHKLEGELQHVWSLSVSMNIRMLFTDDETYYFFDIGTHDQMYQS